MRDRAQGSRPSAVDPSPIFPLTADQLEDVVDEVLIACMPEILRFWIKQRLTAGWTGQAVLDSVVSECVATTGNQPSLFVLAAAALIEREGHQVTLPDLGSEKNHFQVPPAAAADPEKGVSDGR